MFCKQLSKLEKLLLLAFNEYGELSSARWAMRQYTKNVYPILKRLIKLGLISDTVPYRLTTSGRRVVKELKHEVHSLAREGETGE